MLPNYSLDLFEAVSGRARFAEGALQSNPGVFLTGDYALSITVTSGVFLVDLTGCAEDAGTPYLEVEKGPFFAIESLKIQPSPVAAVTDGGTVGAVNEEKWYDGDAHR